MRSTRTAGHEDHRPERGGGTHHRSGIARLRLPLGAVGVVCGSISRWWAGGLPRTLEEETHVSEKITDSEMNRRTFLGRSALVAGAVVAAPLAASVAQASSKPTSAGGAGAAQQAAGESDFGVPLPADAAPKEYQFVQTIAVLDRAWAGAPWTRSRASTPASRATQPQRAARARGQGLAGRAGPGHQVGGLGGRPVVDVRPPAGPQVDQRRRGHRRRLRRVVPVRGRPGACLGLHAGTTTASSATSGQAARGEAATTEIGVKVGKDKYQVVFETERPDAVPARDAHLVRSRSTPSPSRSTAPASTTSTPRRP